MRLGPVVTVAAVALAGARAEAFTDNKIKIGVLNDQSGIYADIGGHGGVVAAQLAVRDFGGKVNGVPVEVVGADHQNQPDTAANIARQWFDTDGVDAIFDVPNSAAALAVNEVTRQKNKVLVVSGATTSELTQSRCTPNTVHWTYDTYALAHGTGKAVMEAGGDTWFFITADYAFGHDLEKETRAVVTASGGKILGSVNAPLATPDFSSFLLQAQASGAKVVGLANAGGDAINSIKQAAEFGIQQGGQELAALELFITDVNSLGLQAAQGLVFTTAWYWDMTDANRKFAKEMTAQNRGLYPTMLQAGVYASVLHYLKAVQALGDDADGKAVIDKMKELPTDDPLFGKGKIRVDGRQLHDMYLMEVKKPADSKYPWDYYKLRATIPADQAFRPLSESACPLVKKG